MEGGVWKCAGVWKFADVWFVDVWKFDGVEAFGNVKENCLCAIILL